MNGLVLCLPEFGVPAGQPRLFSRVLIELEEGKKCEEQRVNGVQATLPHRYRRTDLAPPLSTDHRPDRRLGSCR